MDIGNSMSRAEQVMKPINVEATMGHDLGISQSYWKPTEREVLEDYLKAVDLLTINNNDKSTLQKQVAELTKKSQEENYIIKGKLAEKEKEIEATAREAEQTKQRMQEMEQEIRSINKRFETFMDVLTSELPQSLNNDGDNSKPFIYFNDPSTGMQRLDHVQVLLKAHQLADKAAEKEKQEK
jgi:seryl-tRNA synthetase